MDIITTFIDIFLHLDKYLGSIINEYGPLTLILLFIILFCETGLVILPFLPGDSLLFASGAFAALGYLNVFELYLVCLVAAVIGDTINYHIGLTLGSKLIGKENSKLIKKEHIDKTQAFYEKHGGKTIILARFVPIIRTFAPFVAGVGKMEYKKFISYNAVGGFLWVTIGIFAGYFFGNLSFVKDNFSIIIIAIVLISVVPMVIAFIKEKYSKKECIND
ncbi:MAG: DedA family protein [Clostridium sp.]